MRDALPTHRGWRKITVLKPPAREGVKAASMFHVKRMFYEKRGL